MGIDISKDLERLDKKGNRASSGQVVDVKQRFPATTSIAPEIVEDTNAKRAYELAEKAKLENPYHLTMDEMSRIYDAIDEKYKNSPLLRQRLRTMITVAYGMGLRSSEYTKAKGTGTNYTIKTIDVISEDMRGIKTETIIKGKGTTKTGDISIPGKDRTVRISEFVREEIRAWLNIREQSPSFKLDSRYLFPAMDGEKFKGADTAFPYTTFDKELKELAKIAGIDERRMHSHIFRHSYGTHLASLGYDEKTIAAELGHSDVSTTQKYYLHVEAAQQAKNIESAGQQLFRDQAQSSPVVPGASFTEVPATRTSGAAYNDAFPSGGNMRAVVDGAVNRFASGSGTINELQNDLRQTGLELSQDEIDIITREAQDRRRVSLEGERTKRPTPEKGTFVVSHDSSALKRQAEASRVPSTYTAGAPLGPDDIIIDFKNNKDARKGARLVLKIAVDRGVNIHQAFDMVVDAFEAAHYQLGDSDSRKQFRERVEKLFPFGLGKAGQRNLVEVGEDWGGTSQKTKKPRIFSKSGFESHIIAQYLFDEGYLEDIDPPDSDGKRPGVYAHAERGLFRDSQGQPIAGERLVKVNDDGTKSFKRQGGKNSNTWIGNILTKFENAGGQRRIIGIQRDRLGNSRAVRDDSGRLYTYGYFNPAIGDNLGDNLSGYGITDKGRKFVESFDLDKNRLNWVGAVASDSQREFFEDMRQLEYSRQAMQGVPTSAQGSKTYKKHERTVFYLESKYSVVVDGERILFSALPKPMAGYSPETTNQQIRQHLQETTGRKSITNKEVDKFRATQTALERSGVDQTALEERERIRKNAEKFLERRNAAIRAGKAGLYGLGITVPLAIGAEEAMARRKEEATGKYDPDFLKAVIEPPTPPLVEGVRGLLRPKPQEKPEQRIAREMHLADVAQAEAAGRKYEELELVPSRDERTKRREEALVEVRGGTKSPRPRTPLSFMSDEDLLNMTFD